MVAIKERIQQHAGNKVQVAILIGRLKRNYICELCEKSVEKIDAHHPDYAKPLFIIWLCHRCHTRHHQDLMDIDIFAVLNKAAKTLIFDGNQRKLEYQGLLRGRNKRFSEICC